MFGIITLACSLVAYRITHNYSLFLIGMILIGCTFIVLSHDLAMEFNDKRHDFNYHIFRVLWVLLGLSFIIISFLLMFGVVHVRGTS